MNKINNGFLVLTYEDGTAKKFPFKRVKDIEYIRNEKTGETTMLIEICDLDPVENVEKINV